MFEQAAFSERLVERKLNSHSENAVEKGAVIVRGIQNSFVMIIIFAHDRRNDPQSRQER